MMKMESYIEWEIIYMLLKRKSKEYLDMQIMDPQMRKLSIFMIIHQKQKLKKKQQILINTKEVITNLGNNIKTNKYRIAKIK